MKIRLWGFVEQTFLYKTHYHICLYNTAISRNANRLFLFYQKKSNFKLFLICILTITPSFLNKIQKVFLRKWSAKKALQSLIEETLLNTLCLTSDGNTLKKTRKFLGKHASRVEVFSDKSVKIWSFCEKPYIFWKRKLRRIFLW
jgi:hypothetical protein